MYITLAEVDRSFSPYNSMWASPINFTDPDGDFAFFWGWAALGGFVSGMATGLATDWDFKAVALATVGGFVAGGLLPNASLNTAVSGLDVSGSTKTGNILGVGALSSSVIGASLSEIWLYGIVYSSPTAKVGHSVAYDVSNNIIYEIQHPNDGQTNGLHNYIGEGLNDLLGDQGPAFPEGPKSVAYRWNMSIEGQNRRFWQFRGGRHHIDWYLVALDDPTATRMFFENNVDKPWDYNLMQNNCNHYVTEGFKRGINRPFSGSVNTSGFIPGINAERIMFWSREFNPIK